MSPTPVVASVVSVVSATGGYFLAETGAVSMTASVWVSVGSGVISLITSVMVLKVMVNRMDRDMQDFRREMREDLREIYGLMRDTSERVARIEGRE
jgi:uncharacterized membrane protein